MEFQVLSICIHNKYASGIEFDVKGIERKYAYVCLQESISSSRCNQKSKSDCPRHLHETYLVYLFICLLFVSFLCRVVYFKFISLSDRAQNETKPCPGNNCPVVQIRIINGNRNDADCRSRLYHNVHYTDVRMNTDSYGLASP